MIGPIRERHAFARLGRDGRRIRRSALWCSWCPDPDSTTTSASFAITRAYGPAVNRNRLRRRLRSVLRELDRTEALPPILIVIGPTRSSGSTSDHALIELTFDQIRLDLVSMIDEIRRHQPTPGSRPVVSKP